MDDWDKPFRGWNKHVRFCDMKEHVCLHRKGGLFYISLYRKTRTGIEYGMIKRDEEYAEKMAKDAAEFIRTFIRPDEEWCIITTPMRRNQEHHFATAVIEKIAKAVKIKSYPDSIQCLNKQRVNPEFHLLRPIPEERVILFDDILTTGSTLTAAYSLLGEKKQVVCIIGINNN